MTVQLSAFFSGFALSAALIMAIGAQNLFVLRQGLRGEHVGPLVLFFGSSDAVLIAAGVGGMGAFLSAVPQLEIALALGGAAFLTWYGVAAFRRVAAPSAITTGAAGTISLGRALTTGAAFTFLNPHVYLDTVLLMGTAGSAQPEGLRPVFVLGAASASFLWFAGLGYGARLLQPVFARPAAWRVLDALVGIVMLSLAASLVLGAVSAMR
ncbi:LysE/ArgO family amino acid transporter [Aureimonas phyllosphaerae]|uniref:L-lysine exporter family protein LysE/ArgO n=1 Tax=Aureimonas phyllosphaerae TaxID=1166078 RepID=A0A7W6BU39_9HYPH|nr:LysE/ArgO family amino acid transporter [Aureimonas phyllosphaerae]MBB3934675.1 L-lysine exporter family protein LysE/ArgO [Aureimonas phyllosphaerae]MBB3958109.1 L-lysine exporter family protein LysE/ArgO [Aureimonas phyllosphaerae]SFE91959.1 L-lysine exporter family protein LysE/ArgO [Aureimonas phyllosphaerae]